MGAVTRENRPDFQLPFPREKLSRENIKKVYVQIFEATKWEMYKRIRIMTRDRDISEDKYYITRNEYKNMMNTIDLYGIRMKVFRDNGIPVDQPLIDPPHEILMRAHYTYIFDSQFDKDIEELKTTHQREIAMLLENIEGCKDMEARYDKEIE